MKSIRARLLAIVLSLFLLAWAGMAIWTWGASEYEIEEVFDAQLAQASVVLLDLTRNEIQNVDALHDFQSDVIGLSPVHHYEKKIAFQIWKDGKLWLRSASAPAHPMATASGYSDGHHNDELWRFLVRDVQSSGVRIVVGERYQVRDEMIRNLNLETVVPMLVTLPILIVLLTLGIRRGLAPLERLTRQIRNRSSLDLQPVALTEVPAEIKDLVIALNSLLSRLSHAFHMERRFTADAAHELRTPLSVIRTQAQIAQREADPAARQSALRGVIGGVDRATRLIIQLLTLARVDSSILSQGAEWVELKALVESAVDRLVRRSDAAAIPGVALELISVHVWGLRELLDVLIRNVLENSINYAQGGDQIRVTLTTRDERVELTFEDNGPGIPAAELERVQERFVRLTGNDAEGTGLGLSIVRQVAELHDATLQLENLKPHGLRVRIRFPLGRANPTVH